MTLFEIIKIYLKTLQSGKGRAAAEELLKNEDQTLVKAVAASFSDDGKLLGKDGKPMKLMDLMGLGLRPPVAF